MHERQLLYSLEKKGRPNNEVRHLILDLTKGSGAAVLSQFTNAVETQIATGTQYEMNQQADALAQEWVAREGFAFPRKNDAPVCDTLKNTVALAISMGYRTVYDSRFKAQKIGDLRGGANFLGEVPLNKWPGLTPKNGGGYVYAFNFTTISACPTLPAHINVEIRADNISAVSQAIEMLKSVGPHVDFILGGNV
jgi:hypothetical protein